MTARIEKLTISLALDVSFEDGEKMGAQRFDHPKKFGGIGNIEILEKIVDVWPGISTDSILFRSDGSSLTISELSKRMKGGENWVGPLQANGLKVYVSELPTMLQTVIIITEIEPGAAGRWISWVEAFICEPSFIQAWVVDIDYDYWQNATDILEYELAGRDYAHLPLKSNGLPFPLQQDIIDVSENPGRVYFKAGYVEAVSSDIWIGDKFLKATGCSTQSDHYEGAGITFTQIAPSIFKIVSSNECFNSLDTAERQLNLRRALYDRV